MVLSSVVNTLLVVQKCKVCYFQEQPVASFDRILPLMYLLYFRTISESVAKLLQVRKQCIVCEDL